MSEGIDVGLLKATLDSSLNEIQSAERKMRIVRKWAFGVGKDTGQGKPWSELVALENDLYAVKTRIKRLQEKVGTTL